ncbi:hypothetical protein BT93_G0309 [Corymbia citriodora subsp. variegata]|nr:hypothetical protein BT93_G0309 [Corymbia citriodora subsp. variegata]
MKIEVQSKKLIKPSAPMSNHSRMLNISGIDELQPTLYSGFLFYYRANGENQEDDIFRRLHLLEESLSETLTIFYPLAGRYVEEELYIDCNDQGVEFVHAKVNGQLDQLLRGEFDPDLLGRLSEFRMGAAGNPLVVVRVNVFECGGLVISLRCFHKVGDLFAMATFLKSWVTACRSGTHELASPNFELSTLFPVKGSGVNLTPPLLAGVKLTMNRFSFSGAAISRLKQTGPKNLRISRVEAVSALLCKVFVTMDRAKHGRVRPLLVCQNMNLRGTINLPIPTNAFGNFITKVIARHTMPQSGPDFEELVKMIHDMFANAKTRFAAIADRESCMDMVKDSAREYTEEVNSDEVNVVNFSSWCGFPLYDIDFGWGKPELVSNAFQPARRIILLDSKTEGGIDAWIILSQEEKVLLVQDPDIVAFTSLKTPVGWSRM